jgi:hypothetical protein
MGWRVQRTLLGLVLVVVAVLGIYLATKGMTVDGTAGDGAVMVTLVTLAAGLAIGLFGLRYAMLGIRGRGVVFYERAVEADFQRGLGLVPRRRTVPLLHVRVSGSSRLTYATAVTTTGHAFRLPASLVERSDVSFLGSLGVRPIAPDATDGSEGEVEPYRHPVSDPLPDHGPAWPDPGTHPITVDVEVEQKPVEEPTSPSPPGTPPAVPRPPPTRTPPAPSSADDVGIALDVAPSAVPEEPEMEVLMDLPDDIPPPETRGPSIPPPPRYRPPDIDVPEPPTHKEMDTRELRVDSALEDPVGQPPSPPVEQPPSPPVEQPPSPPVERPQAPPVEIPSEPASVPSPSSEDEWELEEVPPPDEKRKRPPTQGSGGWEEI